MKFRSTLLVALAATATTSSAYRTTIRQQHKHARNDLSHLQRRSPQGDQQTIEPGDGSNTFDIQSARDLLYLADINVGGVDYPVQLDTGSSDLFVVGATYPIPGSQGTNLNLNLSYAIGWASGHIAFAPVDFVNITIPSQALLDAQDAQNPALELGASGIVGLGFNKLSNIDNELNKTGSANGRSLLYNMFAHNPQEPNFIAFALHRATQNDSEIEGSFAIGEFEPEYMAITGNPSIPTWPRHDPYRWNVLLDALIVNDTIIPGTTTKPGAPNNKAVVLLDTGASHTYAPPAVVEALYKDQPNATFDEEANVWMLPCNTEINAALQIGGQVFPMHPLDLLIPRVSTNNKECMGTFIPQIIDWEFDWLIGDNFLRAVYSIYDFGDFNEEGKMGDPYVKLLSLVDPDEASIEFHNQRGGEPRTGITFQGLDGASVAPSFNISTDISESLEMISRFIPAMLAVVAFNALVIVVGSIVWLVIFIRKRRRRAIARTPPSACTRPHSYIAGMADVEVHSPPPAHSYEPVSMALTEDTFVPPSPAFMHGSNKLQPGDRPKSAVY
ncbi:aspartic peptidase domain-containing protein [Coprinopsis sp. MPI-PUGE-AT-0042]|nr:aspartic peptidase domain-containing protein [Coprinopsis sp. MPI-PUGE-AT-0042]